jgi:hypothetical protein
MIHDCVIVMDMKSASASTPINDNGDPFATVPSSLAWLYLLRREMLKENPADMSFERRRQREEALKKFATAEALLLAELAG